MFEKNEVVGKRELTGTVQKLDEETSAVVGVGVKQMQNAITGAKLRIVEKPDEPWFVAKDVAMDLGINTARNLLLAGGS